MSITGTACALVIVRIAFQRWKMNNDIKTFPYAVAQMELIKHVDRFLSESRRQRVKSRRIRPNGAITAK